MKGKTSGTVGARHAASARSGGVDTKKNLLERIRIVLVGTTHPGNIGASARAMKNMGLHRLYLVSPRHFPDHSATERAAGADDVLAEAVITETLDKALAGCGLVIGTSARNRALPMETLTPRHCAEMIAERPITQDIAIVFGREHAGLTNDELLHCHYQLQIPCNPAFSSLNLAMSVQLVAYELMQVGTGPGQFGDSLPMPELATADEMAMFYAQLQRVLLDIGFLRPANPNVMRRLKRLFGRAQIEKTEMNILRGVLAAVENREGN